MSNDFLEANAYYYRDPSQRLDVIPDALSVSFLNEVTGNGVGTVTVSRNDPHLIETPESRYYRTIYKLSCGGVVRGGFVVQNQTNTLLDTGEESAETMTLSGDGLKSLLSDIAVLPATGQLAPQSMDDRVFSWASPQGIWYDSSQWVQPVRVEQYGMLRSSPNKYWKYEPAEWPDAPNAWWIWSQAPVNNFTPSGYVYFRAQFTVTADQAGDYSLFLAGDDKYQAYMDASLVVDATAPGNHHAKTERYDFSLEAGTHILAIKAWNKTGDNLKTNFAGILVALFQSGDADAGTAARQVLVSTNGGWRCMAYPANEPGWSVGEILIQLLREGAARGVRAAQWITPNFTELVDSEGVAWANRLPYSFNIGDSLLDVVEKMEELEVEAWIDPDTLQLNVAQQRGTDRSVGENPVQLTMGWNLVKAGTEGEADITNTLLMKTDDGWIIQTDPASVSKYGPIEGTLSTNANATQSQQLAKKVFSKHADAEEGSDYSLIPRPGAVPFEDFDIGDWVLAPDKDGHMARRRVMSIAVSADAAGNPLYTVEFDTIFQTKEKEAERLAKLIAGSGLGTGFLFGSAGGGTGTGSPVTSPGGAGRPSPPLAPANLAATSVGVFGNTGDPQAVATLTWDFVSLTEDGNAVRGVSAYRVYGRLANATDASGALLATVNGALSTAKITGLQADEDYLFWVVAVVSEDRYSDESPAISHHTASPGPNMYPPTQPSLSTRLGTITAAWNGNMTNGRPAPASVSYVYAEYSTSAAGTYTTIGNPISSASTIVLTGLTIGTTYWVRFRARDKANNISDPSVSASIKVVGVDTTDLGQAIQDRITAVESNASTALTNANSATTAAQNANNAVTALSKTTGIIFSSTKPSADNAGKLWIKPTGESYIYDTSKSDWVQVTDPAIAQAAKAAADAQTAANQAAATAQDAAEKAGNALTAANGKNRTWTQSTRPPLTGNTVGDTWWDTANGQKRYTWDGSQWSAALIGTAAFVPNSVTSQVLATQINSDIAKGISDAATADQKAVNAASAASTAQTAANNAATAASTADSKAAAARTAADNAASAASAAQTAADVANAKALSVANGVLVNPGAEFDFDGWDASAKGTIAVQTSNVRSGSKAWQATTNGEIRQGNFAVKPGDTWRFRWWIKGTNTSGSNSVGGLRLQRTDMTVSSPTWADAGSTTAVATSDWTMQEIVYTIPSSGVTNIRARVAFANPAGVTIYFDDFELVNITDAKAAADAATAASNAATTANNTANNAKTAADNAATTAATAKTAADNAATAAANAQTTANQAANDVITAQQTADGKNSIFRGPTTPTPTAPKGNAQGDIYWQRDPSTGVIAAQFEWTGSAWATRTLADATIANLNAGKLTAGFISVDRLQGNSINASKLSIGDFTNLFDDPEFSAGGWVQRSGASSAVAITGTSGLPGNAWNLKGVGTEVSMWTTNFAQIDPSAQYYVSFRAQNQLTGTSPIAYFRLYWYTETGTYISYSEIQVPVGSWNDFSGTFTAPATARRAIPVFIHGNNNTGGSWWFGRPRLRRLNGGELIVDGAITAAKMQVGTITAASGIIADAAITNAKIATAAVDTANIADAAITNAKVSNLDAGKLTAGTLDAGRIGSNSITSRMLAVGDFKEYLTNQSFEDASTGWTFPDGTSSVDSTVARTGSKSIKFLPPSTSLGPITVQQTNLYTDPRLTTSSDWSGSAQGAGESVTISTVTGGVLPPIPTITTRVRGASDKGLGTTIAIQRILPATAGKTYSWGAYIYSRGSTPGYFLAYVQWLDSNLTQIGSTVTSAQMNRSADWQRLTMNNLTAPSGATQFRILVRRFAASGTLAVSDSVDLTGFMFNEGSSVFDYFDGAYTNTNDTGYQWTGTADASTSQKYAYGAQTAKSYYYQGGDIAVLEGQYYGFSGYVRRDANYDGSSAGAFVGFVDAANNKVLGTGDISKNTVQAVGSWVSFSGSAQVPKGTNFIRPFISVNHTKGTLWIDDVSAKVQAGGTLIADGSVTTSKVSAGAIDTNNLKAGAVDTVALKADAVQAVNLAAEAINAKHTITGALIRTSDTGARTEMSADGLQVLDAGGTPLVRLGYGVATGMSVLDSASGLLVPIGNQLFGTKAITRETNDSVPNGTETSWGGTQEVATGLTGISPTGRVLITSTVSVGANANPQDYRYQWWVRVMRSSDGKLFGDYFCGEFGGRAPTTFSVVADVPATQQMTIRLLVQSYKTYGATSNAQIGRRSTAFIPI